MTLSRYLQTILAKISKQSQNASSATLLLVSLVSSVWSIRLEQVIINPNELDTWLLALRSWSPFISISRSLSKDDKFVLYTHHEA